MRDLRANIAAVALAWVGRMLLAGSAGAAADAVLLAVALYRGRSRSARGALVLCCSALLVDLTSVVRWPTAALSAFSLSAALVAMRSSPRFTESALGRLLELGIAVACWRALRLAWLWLGGAAHVSPQLQPLALADGLTQLVLIIACWAVAELFNALRGRHTQARSYAAST